MTRGQVIAIVIFLGTLPSLAAGWALAEYINAKETERKAIAKVEGDALLSRINACEQTGNVFAGVVQLSAQSGDAELSQSRHILPIRDCEATYEDNNGKPVPLPNKVQDEYIEWIGRGEIPILDGNKIVGSEVPDP